MFGSRIISSDSNIKCRLAYIICLSFFLSIESGVSQHFLSTQGTAIVNENQDTILLRGMGLGGWMLQEGYMLQTAEFASAQYQIRNRIEELIGIEKTDEFYNAWLDNHVTREDIDSLKSWGFNSIRLPMHYKLYTLPIEEEPLQGENTWIEKGFQITDSLISWCKENEMYVILDLHGAPGGQGQDQGISDYDPSKPSLWESKTNRDKTVALWKRLAERYAAEQWVAAYDLLNEPNWNIPGNIALRDLYREITDSIRTVDSKHILIIEGNWFANDFTNLTPPWDENFVYGRHKYWSINDQASIQWVLDIRKNFNVPLYFGESGENSNVWFKDAIKLFEDNEIGWAWWPMKKIESISGPLSVVKTPEYESLLNYWKGNGAIPDTSFTYATLMELTELLKIENCIYQKDVIDAMFRQINSENTKAFKNHQIPGVIFATDFDMGVLGQAYFDNDVANYHVSTGNYTAWNSGWSYRNDAVDIESCSDNINSNGYNVGWIESEEWLQFDIDVQSRSVFEVQLRTATPESTGRFHFQSGEARISESFQVPSTGDWANWQTMIVSNIILEPEDQKLKVYFDEGGFNLSSLEFIEKESSINKATKYQHAETLDAKTIQLQLNKNLEPNLPDNIDFSISVNGLNAGIESYSIDVNNSRTVNFVISEMLRYDDVIRISYQGNSINALDGSLLESFNNENVINTLDPLLQIPGRIEMEDYNVQYGVSLESTTDIGGGYNISFLDAGDYLDYNVNIESEGTYLINYRTAGQSSTGRCRLSLIDQSGDESILTDASFPPSGDWQNWATYSDELELPEGDFTLRVLITQGPFNMNWIEFLPVDIPSIEDELGVSISPNPTQGKIDFKAIFSSQHKVDIRVYDFLGRLVKSKNYGFGDSIEDELDFHDLSPGQYYFEASLEDDTRYMFSFVKI